MLDATPAFTVPTELVEQVLEAPVVSEDRLAAGRSRAAVGPVGAEELADAVVAEGPPLLHVEEPVSLLRSRLPAGGDGG